MYIYIRTEIYQKCTHRNQYKLENFLQKPPMEDCQEFFKSCSRKPVLLVQDVYCHYFAAVRRWFRRGPIRVPRRLRGRSSSEGPTGQVDPGRGRLKRALLLRPPASHLPQGRGDPLMDCADYEETHLRKRVDLCALSHPKKCAKHLQ